MILNPRKVELVQTAFLQEQLISDHRPQVAFAGRSNVGKSSLLNRLFNRRNLARVSRQPGKTRSINFFLINEQLFFVDLPGYGYAKAGQQEISRWRMLVEHYFENSSSLKGLVHLLDIRHDPSALDIELFAWTKDVVPDRLFVLTKSDKLTRGKIARAVESLIRRYHVPEKSIVVFSAETGLGRKEILGWIGVKFLDRT